MIRAMTSDYIGESASMGCKKNQVCCFQIGYIKSRPNQIPSYIDINIEFTLKFSISDLFISQHTNTDIHKRR